MNFGTGQHGRVGQQTAFFKTAKHCIIQHLASGATGSREQVKAGAHHSVHHLVRSVLVSETGVANYTGKTIRGFFHLSKFPRKIIMRGEKRKAKSCSSA
jgi:hypothetical protein